MEIPAKKARLPRRRDAAQSKTIKMDSIRGRTILVSQTVSTIEQQLSFPQRPKLSFSVIDVGGEVTRAGLFTSNGELAWPEEYRTQFQGICGADKRTAGQAYRSDSP